MTNTESIENGHIFATQLGWVALVWNERRLLTWVLLAYPSRESLLRVCRDEFESDVKNVSPAQRKICERVTIFLAGESRDTFDDIDVDFGDATPFQKSVWNACRRVLPGERVTYAELAFRAGFPRAARAVGSAMAANRTPLIVPCHRVVRSDGHIGAFSAFGGAETKSRLLELERGCALGE
ncbi:MAG: methylated-DNA--[protein]-cysteine S-methyltransferase [Thermoguttaceae bacterium]